MHALLEVLTCTCTYGLLVPDVFIVCGELRGSDAASMIRQQS